MKPIEALRDMLAQLARAMSKNGLKTRGYAYSSPAEFVLQHGIEYTPRPLPKGLQMGLPKHCYSNAIVGAYAHRSLFYVEGYALNVASFPIHHAWLTDDKQSAFDPTWRSLGTAYLGIMFNVGRADDASWNGDATVLDDWKRHWPLLKQPWTGEDMEKFWEPTEATILLKDGLRLKAEAARRQRA